MSRDYSDLQVVPDRSYPEVVPQFGKEPTDKVPVEPPQQATPPKRICGLSPKRFWIIVVVVILITGAVIGGAVGGTQTNKSKSNDDTPNSPASTNAEQATTEQATTEPTKTSTSTTASLSTRTLIGPSQTLYRDCPSSNDTIYSALGSSNYLFRKRCNVGFAGSPDNVVNIPATSLDDCIDKCATYNENNKTEIASRESNVCNSVCWRHRVTGDDWPGQCFGSTIQNSTSSGFPVDEDQIECDSGAWINQEIPGRGG
ncbi:hypothetical protein CEP53_000878 [Fusarium sp. AF-6]|nr:hypothetical protein CEP53_000878 [Fusarium sp. AF-6]